MTIMATSAYLSQGGGPPSSDQEEGVMNLVNTSNSQGYSLPREQVVGFRTLFSYTENLGTLLTIIGSKDGNGIPGISLGHTSCQKPKVGLGQVFVFTQL